MFFTWLRHRSNKAIAPAVDRSNDPLDLPIIRHGFAGLHDAVVQQRLAGEQARPEMVQEFLTAHDVVAMLDKIGQDVEDPGFHFAGLPGIAEFIQGGVEFVVPKDINHAAVPPPFCQRLKSAMRRRARRRKHRGDLRDGVPLVHVTLCIGGAHYI